METIYWMIKRIRQVIMDHHYAIGEALAGRYRIEKVLQNGSYGIIYLCWDLDTMQKCVVKQMRKSKKKENGENYKQEVAILELLHDKAIPKLIEAFEYQGNQFFSMEYIEGLNVEDTLFASKQKYSEKECLKLAKKLTTIVCYIHEKGVIHGDIRISNVLLRHSQLFLIDFGLAYNLHTDSKAREHQRQLKQEDYFDIGDFLLFLLYSSYNGETKKNRSWTEELSIHPKTTEILKRLLQINHPYEHGEAILADMEEAINNLGTTNNKDKLWE